MEYKDCSIGILDYKCGNLNSLKSIIKSIGFNCFISNQKKELLKIILSKTREWFSKGVFTNYYR